MSKKIFWGGFFTGLAAYVILNTLGYTPDITIVRFAVAILCVALFVVAAVKLEFGGMLLSLAILAICFDKVLGIEALTPWPVLIAAVFGTIGLNILFGDAVKRWKQKKKAKNKTYRAQAQDITGDSINLRTRFSGECKQIHSDQLTNVNIDCAFGGLEVHLEDAMIQTGSAVVDMQVSFGGVELYVPKEWKVVNNTTATLGGYSESGADSKDPMAPTLVLQGTIRFGGVDLSRV